MEWLYNLIVKIHDFIINRMYNLFDDNLLYKSIILHDQNMYDSDIFELNDSYIDNLGY